jgi:transglutaminase-like putative cysteine protease
MAIPRAYASHKDSVPDWVRDAAKETLPESKRDPSAIILLDDAEYTVQPNGHVVLHKRIVKRILRPQGRTQAEFFVWYNKDSKVNWMHVWSIGPDGHEYQVKNDEFKDYAGFSFALYEDDRARSAQAPAGDPGAVVAMEYEEQMPYYRPEILWALQDRISVHHNRLTVQLPPGFLFDTKWRQHDPIAPTDLGNNRWQWESLDVPHIDMKDVKLAPPATEFQQRMALHYAGPGTPVPEDWQSIGVWYQGLTANRIAVTPEMTAKAQALTAGMTDFYQKAKAIDNFVRGDIRYVAVEIGIGGYQPHAAADIFRNRYGDCKDKATLLAAMLSAVGIRSTWLMVDTERGVIAPEIPSLEGNHMIAAVELPVGYNSPEMHSVVTATSGKRFLITDPTWNFTPFGQIEDNLQGSYALLVDGSQSEAIKIPMMPPERNRWTRTAHLKLAIDGSLSGDVSEQLYGDQAADTRLIFSELDQHRKDEAMHYHVGEDLTGFTLTNVKMENLQDVDQEMAIHYTVSASSYSKTMGSLLMVRPRVLGSDALPFDDKPRRFSINFEETKLNQDEFDVELPPGYVVDEMPEPVKLDVGFASYESKTTVQGSTLHYSRTYTVRAIEVPAKQYDEVRRLMAAIVNDEHSNVVLRKAQ